MNINSINSYNQSFQAKIKLKPAKKDILKLGLGTAEISLGLGSAAATTMIDPAGESGYGEAAFFTVVPLCMGSSTISNTIDELKENGKNICS